MSRSPWTAISPPHHFYFTPPITFFVHHLAHPCTITTALWLSFPPMYKLSYPALIPRCHQTRFPRPSSVRWVGVLRRPLTHTHHYRDPLLIGRPMLVTPLMTLIPLPTIPVPATVLASLPVRSNQIADPKIPPPDTQQMFARLQNFMQQSERRVQQQMQQLQQQQVQLQWQLEQSEHRTQQLLQQQLTSRSPRAQLTPSKSQSPQAGAESTLSVPTPVHSYIYQLPPWGVYILKYTKPIPLSV